MHTLAFDSETAVDAVFVCTVCGQKIGFNKAQTSDPHAVQVNGEWQHPDNADNWMTPCTQ